MNWRLGKGQKSKRIHPAEGGKPRQPHSVLSGSSLPDPTDDVAEDEAEIIKRRKGTEEKPEGNQTPFVPLLREQFV